MCARTLLARSFVDTTEKPIAIAATNESKVQDESLEEAAGYGTGMREWPYSWFNSVRNERGRQTEYISVQEVAYAMDVRRLQGKSRFHEKKRLKGNK